MNQTEYLSITVFSRHHGVESAFIKALGEHGLLQITEESNEQYLALSELAAAEKMIRLHLDLQLNPESIDVILNLMQKMEALHSEIIGLRNRLGLYE